MPLEKPVESLAIADLLSLIASGFSDARLISFKRELPRASDAGREDFLREIASFANASGGHILYGVTTRDGAATHLTGLDPHAVETAIVWMNTAIPAGIAPRIFGVKFHAIHAGSGKQVLVVRVPRTWAGPHMVTFNGNGKFYSRNSSGRYSLDVEELRSAFTLGEEAGCKMRAFRLERINAILNGELSVQLSAAPKTVLHILPLVSFSPGFRIDFEKAFDDEATHAHIRPMAARGLVSHHNFEGLMTFSSIEKYAYTYVQLFRNGCVEATENIMLESKDGRKFFPSTAFEKEILYCGEGLLALQKQLGIAGPRVVMLSFLGVRGYSMFVSSMRWQTHTQQINRDNLFLDEVIADENMDNLASVMRPVFDQLWNACGWARSLNYDAKGKWREYNEH